MRTGTLQFNFFYVYISYVLLTASFLYIANRLDVYLACLQMRLLYRLKKKREKLSETKTTCTKYVNIFVTVICRAWNMCVICAKQVNQNGDALCSRCVRISFAVSSHVQVRHTLFICLVT